MIYNSKLIPMIVVAGLAVWTCGCNTARTARTSTPATPAGPVQTASAANNLIPAGTVVPVRTNGSIETAKAGGTYSGVIDQDVVSSDYDVLIRKGSPVELTVVRASGGGAVGTPEIELAIQAITVNGRRYSVNAAGNVQQGNLGLGANERTARSVGGGAALGTIIGAIAGGAKGAAVGAAVGAAGGATAQVLTRGKEVSIPAESVLSFKLNQAIQLV